MKKIIVCNQKMYLTEDEAVILKNQMDNLNLSNVDLVVCPSYLNFNIFKDYNLGAQDCFYEDKGAYTGFISSYDLSLRNIKYSLVGHFERRNFDDDNIINLKIKAILRNSMTPILCIGETKLDKDLRRTAEVIKKQLVKALNNVYLDSTQTIYIAYEPCYLIGGKNLLSKDEIIDTINYIRKIVDNIGINNYKLLYGGSINSSNISELMVDNIDGYLLGNSSISFEELNQIINCINSVK